MRKLTAGTPVKHTLDGTVGVVIGPTSPGRVAVRYGESLHCDCLEKQLRAISKKSKGAKK